MNSVPCDNHDIDYEHENSIVEKKNNAVFNSVNLNVFYSKIDLKGEIKFGNVKCPQCY